MKTLTRFLTILFVIAVFLTFFGLIIYKLRLNQLEEQLPENSIVNNDQIDPAKNPANLNRFLPFGNPSNAVFSQSSANNYLIADENFSLSYNRSKGISNWVMWKVDKNSFGKIRRQNDFRPDDRLPESWTKISPNDYSGSGYGRGHLCPSADRSFSAAANSFTFMMSNIAPQTNDLNAGPWQKLETYSRSLARRNNTLYIIAGQYGDNGKIKNKLTIPTNFWKIILVVSQDSGINKDTRIIAVDMPNIKGIEEDNWRTYRTTVEEIEKKTNYKFLTNLSDDLQKVLKRKMDTR